MIFAFHPMRLLLWIIAFAHLPLSGQEAKDDFWGDQEGRLDVEAVMSSMAETSLQIGEPAPEARLLDAETGKEILLSEVGKERPLVLFFGSATCSFNIEHADEVKALFKRYGNLASFAWVYVREAHSYELAESTDHSDAKRLEAAKRFRRELDLPFPVYVDPVDDRVVRAYAAWPTRMVVILPGGKVGYSSAVGHWGFRPLRTTESFEPAAAAPFVPPGHRRPSLQSYLQRLFPTDRPWVDRYSGEPILTSRMAREIVFSRMENAPLVGEPAIDLELFSLAKNQNQKLSDYWKDRPLVLTVGSLSAVELSASLDDLLDLYRDYGEDYQFVHVYIRESEGIRVGGDPRSLEDRVALARRWKAEKKIPYPVLVDSLEDHFAVAYSAWPSRLVVIGGDGEVRYSGFQGPWGFCARKGGKYSPPAIQDPRIVQSDQLRCLEAFLSEDATRNP